MKYIILFLLCFSLCVTVGCAPVSETPTDVPSKVTQTHTDAKEVILDIAYRRYWTWNDLYDYLESPLQSGTVSFDADEQTLFLFAPDQVTKITRWDAPLEDGMVALLQDKNGQVVRRFFINITDQPERLDETSSQPAIPSVVSIPNPENPSQVSQPETVLPKEKTVITLRGKSNKALKKTVDSFNKQSDTIVVVLTDEEELFSAAGLAQEMNTFLCPDVVLMDHSQYMVASQKGLLVSFNEADQEPFGLPIQGGCYGIPLGKEAFCTAANQDVLYHCGGQLPQTYEQMMETAQQVKTILPDTIPLGLATNKDDPVGVGRGFADWLFANGGRLFTVGYDAAAFHSDAGAQTLNAYCSFYEQGLIANDYKNEDFIKGNVAFGQVSSTQYEQVFGKLARHNYAPLPLLLPNDVAVSTVQTYYYCIPQNQNKEKMAAAYTFLSYMMTDVDRLIALCKTAGVVPEHPTAREDSYYQTEAWQIFMQAADAGNDPPSLDCMETIYGYVTEAVLSALQGEDPENALALAKTRTEQRLSRH